MKENLRKALLLYGITDRKTICDKKSLENTEFDVQLSALLEAIEQAILGGVTMIQLREKDLSYELIKKEAIEVQKLCKKYQVPFLINDYVTLAKEIGADGVHVGQSDCEVQKAREILGEDAIIGATAKTVEQALKAQNEGADYLGSGAVFGSSTKLDAKAMEHSLLQQICESVSIPVVAIGGITLENVTQLSKRKMAGFALIGGLFSKADIKKEAEQFIKTIKQMNV